MVELAKMHSKVRISPLMLSAICVRGSNIGSCCKYAM